MILNDNHNIMDIILVFISFQENDLVFSANRHLKILMNKIWVYKMTVGEPLKLNVYESAALKRPEEKKTVFSAQLRNFIERSIKSKLAFELEFTESGFDLGIYSCQKSISRSI